MLQDWKNNVSQIVRRWYGWSAVNILVIVCFNVNCVYVQKYLKYTIIGEGYSIYFT